MNTDLRYPIGTFQPPEAYTSKYIDEHISVIEHFATSMKQTVAGLSDAQLDTPYRPDGWTIRQVVNHCADSHMNCLIRFKLALTEDTPTIRPYYEDRWAELEDTKQMDIAPALMMLEGIHVRWGVLLRSLSQADLKCTFVHPEMGRAISLEEAIGMYSWHCRHHISHIGQLKLRKGW